MEKTIITVPHAICEDGYTQKEHLCDFVSLECGKRIYEILKERGENVILLYPEQTRFYFDGIGNRVSRDMNRIPSRKLNFRQRLSKEMETARKLWDIHSFPRMKKFPFNNDVYLLQDDMDFLFDEGIKLVNKYRANGFKCELIQGSKNDITNEAREKGLKTILLEVCEDIHENDRRDICQIFADWSEFV